MADQEPQTGAGVGDGGWEAACHQALLLAGRVTASVTHELKNQLAVIKETAGLMEDMSLVARVKGPLDPARVEVLSQRLANRVVQADDIIKRLNRFAHSADQPAGMVRPNETLELMALMYRRLADMRPVALDIEPVEGEWDLFTSPMLLNCALFACLEAAVHAAPSGGKVTARALAPEPDAVFEFYWSGGEAPAVSVSPQLLAVVRARLEQPGPGRLRLAVAPLR